MKSSTSCKNLSLNIEHFHTQQYPPLHPPQQRTTKNADPKHDRNYSLGKAHTVQTCKSGKRPQIMFKKPLEDNFIKREQEDCKSRKNNRKISTDEIPGCFERRREVDTLCFQRLVSQVRKYLCEEKVLWNFQKLTYQCLIRLLWVLKYVQYSCEQTFISRNENEDLKKIYYFWLVVAQKRHFNLVDFFIVVSVIENLQYDPESIQNILLNMEKQLCQMPITLLEDCSPDPKYVFFLKKLKTKRTAKGYLDLGTLEREKISSFLKSFKLNKLRDMGGNESVVVDEEMTIVSKKSCELAQTKRKKIVEQMKASNPKIENIDLIDLLSYRQRDYEKKVPQVSINPQKKRHFPQKNISQIKKQIEVLSKPKPYVEQKTSDEISYEKHKDQFTFHPKVSNYRTASKEKVNKIKNAQKVVLRMKEARQIKEEKQNIIQRGWAAKITQEKCPKGKKKVEQKQPFKEEVLQSVENKIVEEVKKVEQKENKKESKRYQVAKDLLKIPILYIDVNIEEGRKERIVIYDNDSASSLAKQFGQKHKLSSETITRLEGLLQQQIDSVLSRIDQETDEESSFIY